VLQILLIAWPLHPLLLSDQSVDEIVLGAYGITLEVQSWCLLWLLDTYYFCAGVMSG
jgi:hypothetical protein